MNEKLVDKNPEIVKVEHGIDPFKRSFDELLLRGMVVVDKDAGPTSHQTSDYLKRILKVEKVGHSGTLDPKVTGVLVCGLNKATKLMDYMLRSNKEYVCLMYVHKEISKKKVLEVFEKFTGVIMQTPPIVSAVKREERPREIYSIDLLDYKDKGKNVLFRVSCQHGTYIRKLCDDMGKELGTGAHMKELRRTKAGPFKEIDNSIGLDRLRNLFELYRESKEGSDEEKELELELRKYIRPYEDSLADFRKFVVHENAVDSLSHGFDLAVPGVSSLSEDVEMGEDVAVVTPTGELLAMGTALMSTKDVLKKRKGICVKTHKVFIDPGAYPTREVVDKEKKEN